MSKKKTEPAMTEETFSDAMDEAMEQALPEPEPPKSDTSTWKTSSATTAELTWEQYRNLKLTS